MNAKNDLVSSLQATANNEQWERVLSAFRMCVNTILSAEPDEEKYQICLMAYDCGVSEGLYGPNSAVYVGMKRGVDDAVHVSSIGVSSDLLGKAEELGRKHGTLMRSMMEERILGTDVEVDDSSPASKIGG